MPSYNYYSILDVSRDATNEQIKKSYKKLALKYHPDRHINKSDDEKLETTQKFKKLCEAYQILSDSEKRKKYDLFGDNPNLFDSDDNWMSDIECFSPEEIFKTVFADIIDFDTFAMSHEILNALSNDPRLDINISFTSNSNSNSNSNINMNQLPPIDLGAVMGGMASMFGGSSGGGGGLGAILNMSGERNDTKLFFAHTSFTKPATIYYYDFEKEKTIEFFSPQLPANTKNITTKQIFVKSKDGTKVPAFVVSKGDP